MASDHDSWISSALGVDVGGIISSAESAASSVADTVSGAASSAVDEVKSVASSAVDTAESAASAAVSKVESTAESVADTTVSVASSAVNEVTSDVKAAASTASKVASAATSTVTRAASAAASGAESVASDVWDGAKAVGGAIDDEAKDIYKGMQQNAEFVKEGAGAVNKGIDWLEDESKSGVKWVADKAKGIPVAEQLAEGAEKAVDGYIDFEGGVLKGATGLVGGVVGVVADPVDTAKGLYTMSEHIPVVGGLTKGVAEAYDVATTGKTLKQAAEEMADPTADAKYWGTVGKALIDPIVQSVKDGKPMEGVGQAAVQIGALFTGAGEAGAAAEVADVAAAAGKVAEVADAAEVAGTAGKVAEVADAASTTGKVADVAETAGTAGKAADVADATEASDAAADAKRVQVPGNDPHVNPYGPTEPPPPPPPSPNAPTQLPPDYLENPTFPPDPKVPEFADAMPPKPPVSEPPLKGMEVKSLGTPTGDLAGLTDAEIDEFAEGIEGNAKSDTYLEMPGQNPETGAGLQDITEDIKPNGINYHVNHYLSDVGKPTIADIADVPAEGAAAGESVIPDAAGTTGKPAPKTTLKAPDGAEVLNEGGNPIGKQNVEVRYHSTNPKFPDQGPTVQVNTPSDDFGWAGDEDIKVNGEQNRRLLPDGAWKKMKQMTDEEAKASHWPAGGK